MLVSQLNLLQFPSTALGAGADLHENQNPAELYTYAVDKDAASSVHCSQ